MSMRKRYPDHDPRSWGLPITPQPKPAREVPAVSGHWVEDPHSPSGWVWSSDAAQAHSLPVPDHELGTPRRDTAMTYGQQQDVVPSSPHVLDPTLGHDGGGQVRAPELESLSHDDPDAFGSGAAVAPLDGLVACPTCGTGVHRDRLRD